MDSTPRLLSSSPLPHLPPTFINVSVLKKYPVDTEKLKTSLCDVGLGEFVIKPRLLLETVIG